MGLGFVWHGGGAEEKHVVERTLIVEVETSLVTVHEDEGGRGGETGEGIGDAVEGISGRLGGSFVFEQAGFESPGAAKTPVGSDHLLDQADFNAIGRLQATEVIVQDSLETLGRFISHDEMAGEQPGYLSRRGGPVILGLHVLLQRGVLRIAAGLEHAPDLVKEMTPMQVKITLAGHEQYGGREGTHDDLVFAAAPACWNAQNMYPNDPAGGKQWWQNKHQADAARLLGTR
jgi:hypothetical protein